MTWAYLGCLVLAEVFSKEVDSFGVRTPDGALVAGTPLEVVGHSFVGQYAPLSKINIEEKLNKE